MRIAPSRPAFGRPFSRMLLNHGSPCPHSSAHSGVARKRALKSIIAFFKPPPKPAGGFLFSIYFNLHESRFPSARPCSRCRPPTHVRYHLAPGCREDDAYRKAAAFWRRNSNGRDGKSAQKHTARDVRLDGDRKAAGHLG